MSRSIVAPVLISGLLLIPRVGGASPTVTTKSLYYGTTGNPFQAMVSCSSGEVLVSVAQDEGASAGVEVFQPDDGVLASSCVMPLPAGLDTTAVDGFNFIPGTFDIGAAVEHAGVELFRVDDLRTCLASGYYNVPQGPTRTTTPRDQPPPGTIDVVFALDGQYAFVANEYGVRQESDPKTVSGTVGVVAIERDASGFTSGTKLIEPSSAGLIETGGTAIPGISLSPDGTRLYVTSEVANEETMAAGSKNRVLAKTDCTQECARKGTGRNGLLTVIDVAKAEEGRGSDAILATVAAGCSPVRAAETADGKVLWVAARGDNRVLAFSTARLESNPDKALIGYAKTGGTAPVGIALFHHDRLLAVANSNRFCPGQKGNATILDATHPRTKRARVLKKIRTGLFPRNITVGPDDATLYLTNYSSNTLQVISTTVR
jgi:DNA-binding beta-propeller fold protein YncE